MPHSYPNLPFPASPVPYLNSVLTTIPQVGILPPTLLMHTWRVQGAGSGAWGHFLQGVEILEILEHLEISRFTQ